MTLPKAVHSIIRSACAVAIAVSFVSVQEGERTEAYIDIAGVPTICFGETNGVQIGDSATHEQCELLLTNKLRAAVAWVDLNIHQSMPPTRRAALASFCYNVGLGACSKSETFRLINAGDPISGCNALMNWHRAGSHRHVLDNRRAQERELCLM